MKYLIVNADDFGLTKGINQGIIKAFKKGIVSSASIMPVGKAYNDALRLIKENPEFDVGVHLCLTDEVPILPKEEISTLLDHQSNTFKSKKKFFLDYFLGKINIYEIEKELETQIKKVLDSKIDITHIDSHNYIHMLPKVLNVVIKLMKRYKIHFLRYPNEKIKYIRVSLRYLSCFILKSLCLLKRDIFYKLKLNGPDEFIGFIDSGHLSKHRLIQIIKRINNGITELVCHPAILDSETLQYKKWNYNWQEELDAFLSYEVENLINKFNIRIINFKYLYDLK